jgi:hypothetical protein
MFTVVQNLDASLITRRAWQIFGNYVYQNVNQRQHTLLGLHWRVLSRVTDKKLPS